jgi:hypothetical protein
VAGLTFYVVLTLAAGNDVAAIIFNAPVETLANCSGSSWWSDRRSRAS